MVKTLALTECGRWWISRPGVSLLSALTGALLMLGAALLGRQYLEATAPRPPLLLSWSLSDPTSGGDRWLRMHYQTPAAAPCVRSGMHMLYRDVPSGLREYYPLGPTLNGAGLPGSVQNFALIFNLPADLPRGEWTHLYRMSYTCPPLGLVRWVDATAPVRIVVP